MYIIKVTVELYSTKNYTMPSNKKRKRKLRF